MTISAFDIERFSPEERLELFDRLWESLRTTPEAIPVTDAQKVELDRRLEDIEQNPDDDVPLDELEETTRARPKR